ncbi:MAG: prolyl aminopeptidase [Gammaproteobacteria bacterium]|nr:prolyl aminopeptidase [Gammaproteobacteria bacterium]
MHTLYPEIQPYAVHRLAVDAPHQLYIEECGDPDGVPVVFLHGGPGGGLSPEHRRFFDPTVYRIVLFDQRGSGQSTPHAELEGNTTQALVADIERIREFLGIKRWVVFGGSWGSTLALAYAQAHAERVMGLILRGIFLMRDSEIRWFYQHGASLVYPDYWEDFLRPIPEAERDDLLMAYHRRLTGGNELARLTAAKAWSLWEGRCFKLHCDPRDEIAMQDAHTALAMARIENHYFVNKGFLRPNQLLEDMAKIQHIPGIIVHGRYDLICPLENAWTLHQAWPGSELQIVPAASHSAFEPGITAALVRATMSILRRI